MKEIKFRAWDVRSKKMFMVEKMTFRTNHDVFRLWGKEHFEPDEFHIENPDDCILEQFTGFQDSEGKDIYEGDIVIGLWDGELDYSSQKVKVEFKNGAFRENYFNRPIADYIQNYRCKIKIIGNTHEVNS